MYDKGTITIADFQKGIEDSAVLGFENIQDIEVFETPNLATVGYKTELNYTPTGPAQNIAVAYVQASDGNDYVLFRNVAGGSSLLRNLNTGVTSTIAGAAWDMIEYKGYLLISTNAGIVQAYGPLAASPTFYSTWSTGITGGTTLTTTHYIKMLVGQDNVVYLTNGNKIATISSFTAGVTPVAPTATLGPTALQLPDGQFAVTIAELGQNLMIGTQAGATWQLRNAYKNAKVYSWNRSSVLGILNLGIPISFNENSIQQMFSNNNRLYVTAGTLGNVYVTDGSNVTKITKIPWKKYTDYNYNTSAQFFPNAIDLSINGNLLVGTCTATDGLGVANSRKHGVYEINLKSGRYETTFKNTISSGGDGSLNPLSIGLVKQLSSQELAIGWQDGATFGFDITSSLPYTGYLAYMDSALMQIGTRLSRKTFQNIEFKLARPLTAGQKIRVKYRKNLTDSYTTIGEYTFANLGAVISHNDKALIADAEQLQIRIELEPSTSGNIQFLYLRIW